MFRYVWILLGVAAFGGLTALVVQRSRVSDEATVHPSVRFHRALRARAAEIAAVDWKDDGVARRWAVELLDASDRDAVEPVLPALGAPPASLHDDRAHLLFAVVAVRAKSSELPVEVLNDEAEQIDMGELDPALASLAEAVRVYVRAEAGLCDRLPDPSVERPSNDLLEGVQALLVDGAHGCCAVRRGDLDEARERIRRSASDAERLHVAVDRVPLLRAWASLSSRDVDEARSHLNAIDVEQLGEPDLMRYRMLRSAVAQSEDTLLPIVDPRWLSSIVVEGIVEAIGRDAELAAAVEESATARAALRFVEMELRLMRSAREIHPLFEHGR